MYHVNFGTYFHFRVHNWPLLDHWSLFVTNIIHKYVGNKLPNSTMPIIMSINWLQGHTEVIKHVHHVIFNTRFYFRIHSWPLLDPLLTSYPALLFINMLTINTPIKIYPKPRANQNLKVTQRSWKMCIMSILVHIFISGFIVDLWLTIGHSLLPNKYIKLLATNSHIQKCLLPRAKNDPNVNCGS